MTIETNISTPSGKTINEVIKALEARSKELGETTKNSGVAMMINILKSLRQDTAVAKPNEKANIVVQELTQYKVGFRKYNGVTPVIVSAGDGKPVEGLRARIVDRNVKSKLLKVYKVTDIISTNKVKEYTLICKSEQSAFNYVKKIHRTRIQHRKGLAKIALGLAMNKLHNENVNDNVEQQVRNTADNNTNVFLSETGFNNGELNIRVHDKIDYAALALKSGANAVELAMQKTANKVMGMIIHKLHSKGIFDDSYSIPFPELKGT